MRKHSDTFPVWLILPLALLGYFIHEISSVFLDEWLKNKIEPLLGQSLSDFLTRFADAIIPMILVVATVIYIYWYIKRDIEVTEAKARQEEVVGRFDPSDPICVRRNVQVNDKSRPVLADFYRVRVDKLGTTGVDDCSATILSINRSGQNLIAGERLQLPFSNSTHVKRVSAGVPDSVDVVVVYQGFAGVCAVNNVGSIDLTRLFTHHDDYEIVVAISAPNQTSAIVRMILSWTGSPSTSSVRPA
jgi:hypothetical protein